MLRRTFAAGVAGGFAAGAKTQYAPTIAAQAYVWTQSLSRQKKPLAEGLEEIFGALARAGYHSLELTSNFFTPDLAGRTIALLERHKLRLPVVYNGGVMHQPDGARTTIEKTLEIAGRLKPLGITAVNFNPAPKPDLESKNDAELETEARAIGDLARQLRRHNLRLFLHQHAPEMAGKAREWRYVLGRTDPKQVEVCLDVHWVLRGGQDPMTLLREAGPRLASLHLRNSRQGVWLEELTDGDIDYRLVAGYLRNIGFRGYLVVELAWDPETAITRPLEENLRRSRIYAEKIFM
ncbi:MAG: TIM barrel protein [Acidobacteria bacterium]|nr:TIM barrel protein [Acidobacteriota bacterium]